MAVEPPAAASGAGPQVNGAPGAGPAAAAAAPAAGKAAGGLFGNWWRALNEQHGPAAAKHVSSAAQTMKSRAKAVKWSMPVDVKVDFLRPTLEYVKETAATVWMQLPPPVQQAAPYVSVAVGSATLVYAIQQRRLNHQRQRGDDLAVQVEGLTKERLDLLRRISMLKARSMSTPRSDSEVRMATALAEATNAAAAAADAAARAATACIFERPPPRELPPLPR